jgi:hypothetical protein
MTQIDDLLEGLRWGSVGGDPIDDRVMGKAADEIERLRGILLNCAMAMGADSPEFRQWIGLNEQSAQISVGTVDGQFDHTIVVPPQKGD